VLVRRSWHKTPSGWRHVDAPVGVGATPAVYQDGMRAVELVFLACVVLGTSFSLANALINHGDP
jgi:hypothetical protein